MTVADRVRAGQIGPALRASIAARRPADQIEAALAADRVVVDPPPAHAADQYRDAQRQQQDRKQGEPQRHRVVAFGFAVGVVALVAGVLGGGRFTGTFFSTICPSQISNASLVPIAASTLGLRTRSIAASSNGGTLPPNPNPPD